MSDNQLHAFRTFMGLPPDTSDQPACGATITKAYGTPKPTERCIQCDLLVAENKRKAKTVIS